MKCGNCETENQADIAFCVQCGMKLQEVPDTPAPVKQRAFCNRCGGMTIGFAVLIGKVIHHFTRITLLKVEYAGGAIGFDIRWFDNKECNQYQKQLRLAKDRAVEEAENSTANAVTSAMSQFASAVSQPVGVGQPVAVAAPIAAAPVSSADELMKYAGLLEKGLITREEFDEVKAGVLKK